MNIITEEFDSRIFLYGTWSEVWLTEGFLCEQAEIFTRTGFSNPTVAWKSHIAVKLLKQIAFDFFSLIGNLIKIFLEKDFLL